MIALFEERSPQFRSRLEDLLAMPAITCASILGAIKRFLPELPDELIVSGGGTENQVMMQMLKVQGMTVLQSDDLSFASAAKEAVAFALLGMATLDGVPSNVPSATGAARSVILGAVTPAP